MFLTVWWYSTLYDHVDSKHDTIVHHHISFFNNNHICVIKEEEKEEIGESEVSQTKRVFLNISIHIESCWEWDELFIYIISFLPVKIFWGMILF